MRASGSPAAGKPAIGALLLGLLASLFFAVTFVLNRQMSVSGGSWLYSASLRYLFMTPLLLALLLPKGAWRPVFAEIRRNPGAWMRWSLVGFGLFYAPLCRASQYGTAWLVAATWQITIVAGALMTPWLARLATPAASTGSGDGRKSDRTTVRMPWKALAHSSVILAGIVLMQASASFSSNSAASGSASGFGAAALGTILPVLLAAFAYPLGNRRMMQICGGRLSTLQRVFGMTVASLPLWIVMATFEWVRSGPPTSGQTLQSLIVALFSGVVATILFFRATELVSGDAHALAAVESTQAGEVLFAALGGILLFHDRMPTWPEGIGLALVVGGMALNAGLDSAAAGRKAKD